MIRIPFLLRDRNGTNVYAMTKFFIRCLPDNMEYDIITVEANTNKKKNRSERGPIEGWKNQIQPLLSIKLPPIKIIQKRV